LRSVVLLTNNPSKLSGLEEVGVRVEGRLPLVTGVNEVNVNYLETKRVRMGHMIKPGVLARESAKAG
jgi:3,4-dihydroxy 2-butanone 4-phosphate synthase/GTP cyclohydrolase II